MTSYKTAAHQGGVACSVRKRTGSSPRSVRERRWATTCAATGCRSPARASSTGTHQAHPPPGRGPRALQGHRRPLRPRRPALSAPARRPLLRLRRGDRHPLQLSRLADGRGWPRHRAALRRHRQSARARQGALQHHGLSGEGMRRAPVRLYGAAAGAGAAGLGAVHLGERLPRGRRLRHSVQLVPVPGELLRSGAFRVDARQLDRCASRARPVPIRPSTSSSSSRSSTTASSTSACAKDPDGRRSRTGPSAASRCGRTASISATTSSGACRSTTRTRSASAGSSCACRRAASRSCRTSVPTWVVADQGRERPLDLEPRHQPGHHRLGRAGHHRRPHQGEPGRERPRHRDDAQALLRGDRRRGARRASRRR